MKGKEELKPKIGLISITDTPRALAYVEEREETIKCKHNLFKKYLQDNDITVVDPADHMEMEKDRVTFYSSRQISQVVDIFLQNHVEAVIIGCWSWAEPMLAVELAKKVNKPILLYSDEDPAWPATCLITAAGASLWEASPNKFAQAHERIYGDQKEVMKWIKGVCALEKLNRGTLVLWGGSYALRMEYLQDDFPRLKSFLIGDIIVEDQYVLIKYAEQVSQRRVKDFIDWLESGKVVFNFDKKIFTRDVLKKQIALYLASKDRINEIGDEIIGASVKCFNELSDIYGVDPCFIPAFLPYHEDSEGLKRIVPTVCEGDIKGLLTSMILFYVSIGRSPLFGDVTYVGKDYLIISNCGGSSVSYACKNCNTSEVLSKLTLEANCEGVSGGAVGYKCPPGKITIARLLRSKGKYFMHIGLSETIEINKEIQSKFHYGEIWPHTAVKMNVDQQLMVKALGANHLVVVFGDYVKEIMNFCRQARIEIFRIDSNDDIEKWLTEIANL